MVNHKPRCGALTTGRLWLLSADLTMAWISFQAQDTGPGSRPDKVRTVLLPPSPIWKSTEPHRTISG